MSKWIHNEGGPTCFCGETTIVKILTHEILLLCLLHEKEESAVWTLPPNKPENWPNLSNEEMEKLIFGEINDN